MTDSRDPCAPASVNDRPAAAAATPPANPHRSEVTIELDGRIYLLRPSYQALAEIEAMTGIGVMALVRRFADRAFGFHDVTAVITAGLKAAGHPASREKVAEMVFRTGLLKVATPASAFLWNALRVANADAEEGEAGAGDGTGEAPAAEG